MRQNTDFEIVYCVTSGMGYKEGTYCASVGTNNGIQIQRTNEAGDCETNVFCTGGIGKGFINNWDDSGKPSFIPTKNKFIGKGFKPDWRYYSKC